MLSPLLFGQGLTNRTPDGSTGWGVGRFVVNKSSNDSMHALPNRNLYFHCNLAKATLRRGPLVWGSMSKEPFTPTVSMEYMSTLRNP